MASTIAQLRRGEYSRITDEPLGIATSRLKTDPTSDVRLSFFCREGGRFTAAVSTRTYRRTENLRVTWRVGGHQPVHGQWMATSNIVSTSDADAVAFAEVVATGNPLAFRVEAGSAYVFEVDGAAAALGMLPCYPVSR
jgi:hypothetical protein